MPDAEPVPAPAAASAAVAAFVAAPISFFMIRGTKEELLPSGPVVHLG